MALILCILILANVFYQTTLGLVLVEGPLDTEEEVDKTIQLSCRVRNILPGESVVWYYEYEETKAYLTIGAEIFTTDLNKLRRYSSLESKDGDVFTYTLQIVDLQLLDRGNYICGFIPGPRAPFEVLAGAKLTTKLPKPQCSVSYDGRRRRPIPGDVVSLECFLNGSPPVLRWERGVGGEIISETTDTNTAFLFYTIQSADEDLAFRCTAVSEEFGDEEFCEVFPFPRFPEVSLRQIGATIEGSTVTFVCDAVGQQSLKYAWTKLSFNVILDNRYATEENNKILRITELKEEDNLTMVECEATYIDLDMSNVDSQRLVLYDEEIFESTTSTSTSEGGGRGDGARLEDDSSLDTATIIIIVVICIVVLLGLLLGFVIYTLKQDKKRNLDSVEGTVTQVDTKSTDKIDAIDSRSTDGIYNISSEVAQTNDENKTTENVNSVSNNM